MTVVDDLLIPLVDEGLGNCSYLLDLGDGRALAVDPPRDLRAVRAATRDRGLRIAYAAETHLHADFVSGAVQLGADDRAQILASAAGARNFAHHALDDGDEVDLGGLGVRAIATAGHTEEHLSFLLLDGARAIGVFTGGSLIVGAAARTDLLGAGRTVELAHAQYRSLRRLADLPGRTLVWPTHGAGSFCTASPGAQRISTIGAEKATNALLAAPDEETFTRQLLASFGSYPTYFAQLAEVNRRGPALVRRDPRLPALTVSQVRRMAADGAVIVDVRPVVEVAAGHVPGAVSIALRPQFAVWLGWLIEAETPVVIVRNAAQDLADVIWPALNIGYENIVGELGGGLDSWRAAGGEVAVIPLVGPGEVAGQVIDVRQDSEYASGHLPGALHIELGDLSHHLSAIADVPSTVMCSHGERSMSAATLLRRAGHRDLSVLYGGGAPDWAKATGASLEDA